MSVCSSQTTGDGKPEKAFRFMRKILLKTMLVKPMETPQSPEEHPLEIPKQFFQFKVVLLGESAVGKSCLATRFVKEFFNDYEDSTIGASFTSKTLEFSKCSVRLDIWDTAGAEQFHVLAPLYYQRAQAAILIYDVTNSESFERIKFWMKELRMASGVTVVALVGNKDDMNLERTVEYQEGLLLAKSHGFLFFETSAKTGSCVELLFETVAKKLTMLEFPNDEEEICEKEVKDNCGCCNLF